ncbi:hypothetical protein GCM10022294_35610 [Dietzia aurantiaca]
MTYPLVSELADAGIPVTVSCRVLKLARQPYCRWRNYPVWAADVLRAYRINALHDAHVDDPTFGYRYLADEARRAGWRMSRRTAWKLCSQAGILSSAQRRRRGKGKKAAPPVFDDHVQRVFRADAPNRVWLTDITEHATSEGKLYYCAIKDVFSNRIVGYSISDRMTAKLAVDAVRNAVARRGEVAGCTPHADRGSQFRSRRQRGHGVVLVAPADQRAQPAAVDDQAGTAARGRRLDRAEVSPATSPGHPRRLDPD